MPLVDVAVGPLVPFGRLETVCVCPVPLLEQEQGMVRRLEVDIVVCVTL